MVYAMQTQVPPSGEAAVTGCPDTGWVHEPSPPWRVVTAPAAGVLLSLFFEVAEYTPVVYDGAEESADAADVWPTLHALDARLAGGWGVAAVCFCGLVFVGADQAGADARWGRHATDRRRAEGPRLGAEVPA